jgi:hypothetical protein
MFTGPRILQCQHGDRSCNNLVRGIPGNLQSRYERMCIVYFPEPVIETRFASARLGLQKLCNGIMELALRCWPLVPILPRQEGNALQIRNVGVGFTSSTIYCYRSLPTLLSFLRLQTVFKVAFDRSTPLLCWFTKRHSCIEMCWLNWT